ncbi:YceI family protein [Lignipirellula cremea]|uniref:Lipid/polyisoprenoid-binding YceI-like domain-containing protein n=1 Tax=Lignipirellula cremea TaxID=2528010 RepID=A0A518DTS2_9BACT|nr:YceI family protein [Lignipirellula cremea]QDU95240.1 hypothetical protein Pla8534_30550 [Lignipirellula cremea]
MKRILWVACLLLPLALGCAEKLDQKTSADGKKAAPGADTSAASGTSAASTTDAKGDGVALTPANTKIEFVGTHIVEVKPDPDARQGEFKVFTGNASLADGKLTALSVEIDTESIDANNEKLTGHLKSPDFFDVREHPKATFKSTKIESTGEGTYTVTGDLTLLKETKSITFPVTVKSADPLELTGEFIIDRTDFGMNFGLDKVEKPVAMTVTVGDK